MAAKIRLKKVGAKKRPYYRVVVIDESAPRDGREIEVIGWYAPVEKKNRFNFDGEKVQAWIKKGAKPSETVRVLLGKAGILPAVSFEGKPKRKPKAEEKKEEVKAEAKAEVKVEAKAEAKEEKKEEVKAEVKEKAEKPKEEKAEEKVKEEKAEKEKPKEKPKVEAKAEKPKEETKPEVKEKE